MTSAEYKALREQIGTQAEVAALLGIARTSLAKRESGTPGYPITNEAALAIKALAPRKKKHPSSDSP